MSETCCLPDGRYRSRVLDSFGDGMSTGDYVLRDGNGNRIIDTTGGGAGFTSVSAIANSGAFACRSHRPAIYSHCDKMDFCSPDFPMPRECRGDGRPVVERRPSSGSPVLALRPQRQLRPPGVLQPASPDGGCASGSHAAARAPALGSLTNTNPGGGPDAGAHPSRCERRLQRVRTHLPRSWWCPRCPSCPTTPHVDGRPEQREPSRWRSRTFEVARDRWWPSPWRAPTSIASALSDRGDAWMREHHTPTTLLEWVTSPLVAIAEPQRVRAGWGFGGSANLVPLRRPAWWHREPAGGLPPGADDRAT